ncbi:Uncharacterised protein [Vibrio cholerae]|nr:Uncharacterised protein [Vibrio cholerae]
MRRHSHYRTSTVIHQHEVRDIDRYFTAVERMDRRQACRHAFLFHGRDFSFCNLGVFTFIDEGGEGWVIRCRFCR